MHGPRYPVARPIALALLLAAPAAGQTVPFLVPDAYGAPVGSNLRIATKAAGDGGTLVDAAWPDTRWFFVRVAGTQENRDDAAAADEAVSWPLAHAGATLIGADFDPVIETIPGEQLARLLTERTLVAVPTALAAQQAVRVRHIRSAKTLVTARSATQPGDTAAAMSKSGQDVEIRPFFDPAATEPGGDLPLRMYIDGDALGKPRIIAAPASGASVTIGDGTRSTLDLPITEAGPWRVEFNHAAPLAGDAEADWVLYSATFTFEAPAARGAGR